MYTSNELVRTKKDERRSLVKEAEQYEPRMKEKTKKRRLVTFHRVAHHPRVGLVASRGNSVREKTPVVFMRF